MMRQFYDEKGGKYLSPVLIPVFPCFTVRCATSNSAHVPNCVGLVFFSVRERVIPFEMVLRGGF